MRLLIIGTGGFPGAHIRRRALAAGLDVVTAGRSPLPPVASVTPSAGEGNM